MQPETIYTSLPAANDTYYQPFARALNHLNSTLQTHAANADHFTTITKRPVSFTTTKFNYPDIWLRDVAPVITTRMVKFRYQPSYLKRRDAQYLDHRFNQFLKSRYHYHRSALILDGGNVQWNGSDTVILTTQVRHDNPTWSQKAIVVELKRQLAVQHVVFISPEPGDVLGHADGMVHFNDRRQLFINDFKEEPGFLATVQRQIRQQLPNVTFITLPSAYTSRGQYDSQIASAKGLYINMLATHHALYVPQYGLKTDRTALELIAAHTKQRVIPVNVGKISTLGGSLHCLTWDVPSHQFDRSRSWLRFW